MSVQTEVDRIKQNVANTYAVLDALGCEMPTEQNSDNLATTAGTSKVVRYDAQTLTDAQKEQARNNIGATTQDYVDAEITDLKAQGVQQTPLYPEGSTVEECLAWLAENGDISKVYLLPDGLLYGYLKTTVENSGPAYTNLLPTATDVDGTIYNGKGYMEGYRLSGSSGTTSVSSANAEMCASGFITASEGDIVRIKGATPVTSVSAYLITYDASKARIQNQTFLQDGSPLDWIASSAWNTYEDGILTIPLTSANFGTGISYFRFSAKMDANTIITVNEEIKEGSGTTIVETWASTGHAFVPADYDNEIAKLVRVTDSHTTDIKELKDAVGIVTGTTETEKLNFIRNWDAPIYDANIPLFLLETEKTAKTDATNTPDTIYAMYDALMEKHPEYITKTDLGVCSDGVNHVYRYDFVEPEPYHHSQYTWSETKTKAILVSGIHYEWAGIYSLYYALEEITENPKLFDLRRNTHFIVVPVINPYCTITANYNASIGVLNANGVQIHRNFEVGFIYPGESGYVEFGERNHGGTEPLSEMETQCLDNIFKENTDSAFFLTCHNFDADATYGISFIWPSSATKYMCNMGFRLIDKMSVAWLDKYADELADGIASYKTDAMSDNHIRFGHAHVSSTDGTETRQATKYGIQGNNVEVCNKFYAHGTTDNEEPSLSEFTLSRGAETYINFLLMACGLYDYKDKKEYYK